MNMGHRGGKLDLFWLIPRVGGGPEDGSYGVMDFSVSQGRLWYRRELTEENENARRACLLSLDVQGRGQQTFS